ncbi:MAG: rod shape-determining protein MreD [Clostridiales bacterium]|nr:rod shape-determining protein MreD [Clostridiales bacterium]
MIRNRDINLVRQFVLGLLVVFAALLQNAPKPLPDAGFARIFLVVPLVVAIAMFEGETAGMIIGLTGGFLLDMVSAQHMGFHCFFLPVAALLCARLVNHMIKNTLLTYLLLHAITLVAYVGLYWLIVYMFARGGAGASFLFTLYLPSAVFTWAVSPFFYLFLRYIRKFFIPPAI